MPKDAEAPSISLRGGAAIDDHEAAPPFDDVADRPSPEYLEKYYWGIPHLDRASWRYYLPILTEYALSNLGTTDSNAVDAFLASLRPPDRDPTRFAQLSTEEERAVVTMLDALAFSETSKWKFQAIRGGPTNLDKIRGRDKWNSAGYAAAASG
jgi:hypothetical protein